MKVTKTTSEWDLAAPVGVAELRRQRDPEPQPRRSFKPAPTIFPADVARKRRRTGYEVQYTRAFDLVGEIDAICRPLVDVVQNLQRPVAARTQSGSTVEVPGFRLLVPKVQKIADAVHQAWRELVKLLADAGLLPVEVRGVAPEIDAAGALVVTVDLVDSGGWCDQLVARVAPLSAGLAELLGRNEVPNGLASPISHELKDILLPVDWAAIEVERTVEEVCHKQVAYVEMVAANAEVLRRQADRKLSDLGLS